VFDRCGSNADYRPRNLLEWAGSRDLTSIQGSVLADDPTVAVPPV